MFKTLASQWDEYRERIFPGVPESAPTVQMARRTYYFAVLSAVRELDPMAALPDRTRGAALATDYLDSLDRDAAAFIEAVREGRA